MKIPISKLVIGKNSFHKHTAEAIYALAVELDSDGQKTPILVLSLIHI